MGFRDTFDFDQEKYRRNASTYTEEQLRKKHHRKILQLVVYTGSVSAGIGSAPFTFGTSLVGAAYAIRQIYILISQAKLLEEAYLNLEGTSKYDRLRMRKKDVVTGFILAIISAGLAIFIPIGLHDLAALAVSGPAVVAAHAFHPAVFHGQEALAGLETLVTTCIKYLVDMVNERFALGTIVGKVPD